VLINTLYVLQLEYSSIHQISKFERKNCGIHVLQQMLLSDKEFGNPYANGILTILKYVNVSF
jgi:hypothetical protein